MTLKPNENKQIVIANKINEARFKMTRAEQKLFLYCIGIVDNRQNALNATFEMSVSDFADFLELKRKDLHKDMVDITRDMATRVVEFLDEKGDLYQLPVLSKVKYSKGLVEIKVNSELAPYLIDLKAQFTRYSLSEVLSFKSLFSIRIYQILCQWQYKEQIKYSIEDLRFLLNIEPQEFERYNDFKRFVLEKASKEINKNSTLKFAYKEIKTGRKITHIVFVIKQAVKPQKDLIPKPFEEKKQEEAKEVEFIQNPKPKVEKIEEMEQQESVNLSEQYITLEKRLLDLKFSSQKARELITEHGIEYINFVLEKSKIETRDKVENKAGYVLSLVNTYKAQYEEHRMQIISQKEQNRISEEQRLERERLSKEKEQKFKDEQEELSRDILENDPEIFCKTIYNYMNTFIDLKFGFVYHPDYFENRQENNQEENMRLAKEIRTKFLACQSLRDFRNIIKYDEEWLFRAVFNSPETFDKDDSNYYKSKLNLSKITNVELPFKI